MTIKVGDVVAHVESGVTGKVTFVTPQGTAVDVLDPHGGTYCFQTHIAFALGLVAAYALGIAAGADAAFDYGNDNNKALMKRVGYWG